MRNSLSAILLLLHFTGIGLHAQQPAQHKYGDEARQWLLLYKAESKSPSPVYFYAHANGNGPRQADNFAADLLDDGISVVSWGSIQRPNGPDDTRTCWSDCQKAFQWVLDHAKTHGLDASNIVIGGTSRGSVMSWPLAHSKHPSIKGIHVQEALPLIAWSAPKVWLPTHEVHADSPSLMFTYFRPPGVSDLSPDAREYDKHDPKFGLMIVDKYTSFGIQDRVKLVHSLNRQGLPYTSIWSGIDKFILEVVKPAAPAE